MCNQIVMGVGYPTDNLLKEEPLILLGNVVVLDVVIEFAALREFHNHEDIVGSIKHFVQFDNVLMVDKFEYLDLPLHLSSPLGYFRYHVFVFHLTLVNDLDCHPHTRDVMPGLYLKEMVHLTLANPPVPMVLPRM